MKAEIATLNIPGGGKTVAITPENDAEFIDLVLVARHKKTRRIADTLIFPLTSIPIIIILAPGD